MGLFTRKAVDSEARKHLALVNEALEDHRRALAKLQDALDELHSEHRKLRGRFYAARGEVETPQPAKESKADILRRIGYVPGQPAPHRGT